MTDLDDYLSSFCVILQNLWLSKMSRIFQRFKHSPRVKRDNEDWKIWKLIIYNIFVNIGIFYWNASRHFVGRILSSFISDTYTADISHSIFRNYFWLRATALRIECNHGVVAVSTPLLPQNMISTVAIGLWVMVITQRAPRQRGRWQQYSALGVMQSY